jgi:hypothetical protein
VSNNNNHLPVRLRKKKNKETNITFSTKLGADAKQGNSTGKLARKKLPVKIN